MPQCPYCKLKIGFFKSVHPACQERIDTGYRVLSEAATLVIKESTVPYVAITALDNLIAEYKLPVEAAAETAIAALDSAIKEQALQERVTPERYEMNSFLLNHFGFGSYEDRVQNRGQYGLTCSHLSTVLWQINKGEIPEFDWLDGVQFRLMPGEYPVYSFSGITLFEEQLTSSRHYQSISLPTVGGVRWNVGTSNITTQSARIPVDQGEFLIASESLYFGGRRSTFRISYDSVLRFDHYLDGIGVSQNHAHPMVFVAESALMDLGWFFSDAIDGLAERRRLRAF